MIFNLTTLFNLINGFGLLVFIKYCFDNKTTICYNLIYIYSSIQIQLQKIKCKTQREYIENCYFECIDYKNSQHKVNCIEDVCDLQQGVIMSQKYKMIVYNNNYNKICYYPPTKYDLNYDVSKVSFISFKVIIDSNEYTIKLSTPEYNFYIVNNVINFEFIKYYLNIYLHVQLLDDSDYKIEIVDDCVNFITLNKTNEIIFQKDKYIIK
jgi:hypothetical protein